MYPGRTIGQALALLRRLLQVAFLAVAVSACSSGSDSPPPPPPVGGISGFLQYEFPPPNNNCDGLNYDAVELRPIRRATVQLIDANDQAVLDSTVSDDNGNYEFDVAPGSDVFVRVRAELKNTNPSWDVEVRNNVVDPADPNPPVLEERPLYVMDSSTFDVSDQGTVRNLTAATGWGGTSYTEPRAAAPFAILDTIYSSMALVTAAEPGVNFAPLDAFWSPDNTTAQSAGTDDEQIDSGEIGISYYWDNQLFLVGEDGVDTDEFDDHITAHEWAHYFEDNFSRQDSIGGGHTIGDLLDMRLAFSEGYATALAGIALDNPSYCDTLGFRNQSGFEINAENEFAGTRGWYNEISVMRLVYDLWDTDDDGADNSSIGYGPIHDVMRGPQVATAAFASIFSFATELKNSLNAQDSTFVDALLAEQNIVSNIDIWGSTETNDGPGTPDDVLPIYTDLTLGVTTNICMNSQFDSGRDGNKLSEHRYLRLNVPASQAVSFSITANPAPSTPSAGFDCTADPNDPENSEHSDPDLIVMRDGSVVLWGFSCEPNSEVTTPQLLSAGEYIIDANEFRHEDEDSPGAFPEQICFDFTAN